MIVVVVDFWEEGLFVVGIIIYVVVIIHSTQEMTDVRECVRPCLCTSLSRYVCNWVCVCVRGCFQRLLLLLRRSAIKYGLYLSVCLNYLSVRLLLLLLLISRCLFLFVVFVIFDFGCSSSSSVLRLFDWVFVSLCVCARASV